MSAPLSERFHILTTADLTWNMGTGNASYELMPWPEHQWSRHTVGVDPFPAYPHDSELMRQQIEYVEGVFPLHFPVTWYSLAHEKAGRTNGHHYGSRFSNKDPEGKDHDDRRSIICMWGKRTPIHPAMTRYLVAHEYGHAVQEHLEWTANVKGSYYELNDLEQRYAELRGVTEQIKKASGGTWHADIGELFANDFRILVTRVEMEFWPHPGFARPEELPAIVQFWKQVGAEQSWSLDA
jgi:hypothetical protein